MEDATSRKKPKWLKPVSIVLKFQPIFVVPIYFTVLIKVPPFWASLIIALIPLGLRFQVSRRFFPRTPFDLPIIIFVIAMLVGLIFAPYKGVSLGVLYSTLASILIYYGIVNNIDAGNIYWLSMAGIICALTLTMSIWFFAQGQGREFGFNRWVFHFFSRLIGNKGPSLSWNSIAALLVVVIPPFFSIALFKNNPFLRVTCSLIGLIFFGILFMTISGGGWIAVICALALVFVYWRRWMLLMVVPLIGITTAVIVILYKKISWLMTAFQWSSFLWRTNEWSHTFHLIKGISFFTGLGPGNWVILYNKQFASGDLIIHSSYFQYFNDAGILGIVALILAAVIFIRWSLKIFRSARQNPWYSAGVGLIGSIVAGAIFACYDVTFSGTLPVAAGYIYFSIPLLWIIAALFVVSQQKLIVSRQSPLDSVFHKP
jgi:hypothetical protein